MNGFSVTQVFISKDGSAPYEFGNTAKFYKVDDGYVSPLGVLVENIPTNGRKGMCLKLGYKCRHIVRVF